MHFHTVIIERRGRVLLEQRPGGGLWSRMWQTPTVEAARRLRPPEIRRGLGIELSRLEHEGGFEHRTTHRHIRFHIYFGRTRRRSGVWRSRSDTDDLPMSNAMHRVLRFGSRRGG